MMDKTELERQEPVQLELFEEFEQVDQQKLVDEKTLTLFKEKSDFLLMQSRYNPFDFNEIYLRDFIGYVFERKGADGVEVEPFEEEGSREYKDIWLPQQRDKRGKKTDYSGYGIWRYNPIVLYRTMENGKPVNKHSIILKDYASNDKLDFIESRFFSIISPVTYVGRNRYAKNARYLYAFVIDLDGVGMKQIRDVIHQQRTDLLDRDGKPSEPFAPMANIIVNSGHGLHMYYLLERPVALYKENAQLLRKMKEGLTNIVWNEFTSDMSDIQYQGVYQGFRMPGSLTKFGEKIRAFRNTDAPMHSIASLNGFLSKFKLTDEEIARLEGKIPYNPTGVTLDEAKRQWPDWYERVIVMGDKRPKKWHIKRDLYDWWLRRLRDPDEQIVQGHRYFCLLTLAIYAMKCDIDKDELERDAYSLLGRMDKVTTDEDNHFTTQDIEDALMGYKLWYCTFPRNSIKYLTGLEIKENRRNGRKRKLHLAGARAIQKINDPAGKWRNGNGRKKETLENSKIAARVREWMESHPGSHNKSECARDLTAKLQEERRQRIERRREKGMKVDVSEKMMTVSRTTVIKWWNIIKEESSSDAMTNSGDSNDNKEGDEKMTLEKFGIKLLKMDGAKGTVRLQMPDGHTHSWSHYNWKSRKVGEDFINKFLLSKLFPNHKNISVEHHKNWERMWACFVLDTFPLGVEYAYSCNRIKRVEFCVKSELIVDFQHSEINVEIGGILNVTGTRQFFELSNSLYLDFLQKGWCYYDSGPIVFNKMMILPKLIRIGN